MKLTLNKTDQKKWLQNQLVFLKPLLAFVGVLYIGFLIPRIEENGIQLLDFVPTNAVITSVALYLTNLLYDYLRKVRNA